MTNRTRAKKILTSALCLGLLLVFLLSSWVITTHDHHHCDHDHCGACSLLRTAHELLRQLAAMGLGAAALFAAAILLARGVTGLFDAAFFEKTSPVLLKVRLNN